MLYDGTGTYYFIHSIKSQLLSESYFLKMFHNWIRFYIAIFNNLFYYSI